MEKMSKLLIEGAGFDDATIILEMRNILDVLIPLARKYGAFYKIFCDIAENIVSGEIVLEEEFKMRNES